MFIKLNPYHIYIFKYHVPSPAGNESDLTLPAGIEHINIVG
jgi:hypothetical protein